MRTLLSPFLRMAPLVFVLTPTLGGCGAPSDAADEDLSSVATSNESLTAGRRAFVGAVGGTDARVGIVVEGERIAVFVCGGPSTVTTHTRWFRGALAAGAREVQLTKDGWSVRLWRDRDQLVGLLDGGDGAPLLFTAHDAAAPYLGLYSVRVDGATVGVVVSDDDGDGRLEVQGAVQEASSSGVTSVAQVTPVRIASIAPPALVVQAPVGGVSRDIVVRPLLLSSP
jgi:hypothetical protein